MLKLMYFYPISTTLHKIETETLRMAGTETEPYTELVEHKY